jgi:MFS superfamily sulfate permease-like transporter
MVGFLTGVSALVVLSQLGDFTGYYSLLPKMPIDRW